jgi:beta-galactosidase
MKAGASAEVSELHTPCEVPRENGNRMATRWVEMTEVSSRVLERP